MPASAWKGLISFGLVSIPIRLYPAARRSPINLHQIHSVCRTRLRQPFYCPVCERIVDRNEILKGYENKDGTYVLVDPEEIKKIQPESSRVMEILAFTKQSEIDPLWFDSSYFMVPENDGRKAYQLLLKTLEHSARVAISQITMHQREHTAFIRPYGGGLALHTMYFASEIRRAPGYGSADNIKLRPEEIMLAEQLVSALAEEFRLENYHDQFQARLKQLIAAKQKGRELAVPPQPHRAPVIDIMAALKKSLETTEGGRKPVRAVPAPAHHRRTGRRAAS